MESLEHTARILHAASMIGSPARLRDADVAALKQAREAARAGWEAEGARLEEGEDE